MLIALKYFCSVFLGFIIPTCIFAENLIKGGDAEDKDISLFGNEMEYNETMPFSGKYCYKLEKANTYISSAEFIPIDPNGTYKLSGVLRGDNENTGPVFFGLMLFDANKCLITCPSVNARPDTTTKLTSDVASGDTVLKIENAEKWINQGAFLVAFNAEKSLEDLPNFDFSSYIKSITCGNGFWEVELTQPIKKCFPSGTQVRQHGDGPYMFCVFANQKLSSTWQNFSGVVSKSSKFGATRNAFWRGAKFAKILIMSRGSFPVFIDDIVFEKTSIESISQNSPAMEGIKQLNIDIGLLKKYFYPFAFSKQMDDDVSIGIKSTSWGGFACDKIQWTAAGVKQVEITAAAAEEGGYLMLEFTGRDGTRRMASSMNVSMPPDGKFHKIIFSVGDNPQWSGIIETLRLRWCSNRQASLRLASIIGKKEFNLFPDASQLERGIDIALYNLRPRGEYVLRWCQGKCSGATLKILDSKQQELQTITMKEGVNEIRFRLPALAVKGLFKINHGSTGFPELQLEYLSDPSRPGASWRGNWIWSQRESGPEYTNVWFKKTFALSGKITEATLAIAADDAFEVFVNGTYAGNGNYWPVPARIDVKKYLKPGENELVVKVRNIVMMGGLLCDFYALSDNAEIDFCSDKTWTLKVGGETIPTEINEPALVIGNAGSDPWSAKLGHSYCGPKGIVEVLKYDKKSFMIKTIKPTICDVSRINFKIVAKSGKTLNYQGSISPSTGSWKKGATISVRYDADLKSLDFEDADIYIDDPFVGILNSQPIGVAPKRIASQHVLQQAVLSGFGERPVLTFGGKKYSPIFWMLDSVASNPGENFSKIEAAKYCGIDLLGICCRFIDFWKDPEKFDFSEIDRQIEIALITNPNAVLMLQIYCYMPDWWLRANPDEVCKYYNNLPLNPAMDKQSLASKKWLADCRLGLKALIDHIKKSSYADKIFAASLSESINSEWFWNQSDKNNNLASAGHSKAAYDTFRTYLKEKYIDNDTLAKAWKRPGITFENFSMPTPEEQGFGRLGSLLDPVQDRALMDWFEFRNRSLAEAIIELCKIIKEESDGKLLTGVYYGYFVEFCSSMYRNAHDVGHNNFIEVAKSPFVDFVRAPSRYYQRMIGMADGIMQLENTFSARGKLIYVEQDFRSFTGIDNQAVYGRHNTPCESIGALNRAFGMMLAQGVSQYWLDFGRWLEEKCLLEVIREQSRTYAELPPVSGTTPREVCIIHDQKSLYYTKIRETAGAGSIFIGAVGGLMRNFNEAAMPYNNGTLVDLLEKDILPPHKFYIMTTALVLDKKQRQQLLERFEREKASVLWMYAPGLFYPDEAPSEDNIGDFIGLKIVMDRRKYRAVMNIAQGWGKIYCENWNEVAPYFYPERGFDNVIGQSPDGRPMLVSVKRNGATHYFSTLLNLPNETLRVMAAKAGVHIYNKEISDPLWIGNDVVFLHAKSSGEKSIILPPKTKMRAIIGPISGIFESGQSWNAEAGQTYGFLVEKSTFH